MKEIVFLVLGFIIGGMVIHQFHHFVVHNFGRRAQETYNNETQQQKKGLKFGLMVAGACFLLMLGFFAATDSSTAITGTTAEKTSEPDVKTLPRAKAKGDIPKVVATTISAPRKRRELFVQGYSKPRFIGDNRKAEIGYELFSNENGSERQVRFLVRMNEDSTFNLQEVLIRVRKHVSQSFEGARTQVPIEVVWRYKYNSGFLGFGSDNPVVLNDLFEIAGDNVPLKLETSADLERNRQTLLEARAEGLAVLTQIASWYYENK